MVKNHFGAYFSSLVLNLVIWSSLFNTSGLLFDEFIYSFNFSKYYSSLKSSIGRPFHLHISLLSSLEKPFHVLVYADAMAQTSIAQLVVSVGLLDVCLEMLEYYNF